MNWKMWHLHQLMWSAPEDGDEEGDEDDEDEEGEEDDEE